ncbi:MAG TPA: BON domain-containing protein [Steroidobacteraceae bacterium]|jgi:osmotically-inducible protein OsmY|nr:BON domain-containing protein [Steroidobacteraceae bacterium]
MERRPQVHHRPDGVVLTDEDIRTEVAERLRQMADIDARHVAVEVQGCLVTLTGHVCDAHTRHLVGELVEACPGVQDVENRIRVQAS